MANYDRLNQTGLTTMLNRIAQLVEPVISILPISKGGTGNADGYIRTGKASNTTAAEASTIEGVNNTVEGKNSHAEGNSNTVNKITDYPNADLSCHVEGYSNTMTAQYSHAEGANNTVTGATAHAEGMNNTVSQQGAHAEGRNNTASGYYSHAEGGYNNATSYFTHAAGSYNNAGYENQSVVGTYNNNKATTLFEVGNGTENARSNAFEVYSDGHVNVKGGIYKNGTEIGYGSGTVTSVAPGAGLTGGSITSSGTIKAKLKSETQSSLSAASKGSTSNREYAVGLDNSGYLSVNVPWESGGGGDIWTSSKSCLTGDTSCTITDSNIHTTSIVRAYAQTTNGYSIGVSRIAITEGQAIVYFVTSLGQATDVVLQIINL